MVEGEEGKGVIEGEEGGVMTMGQPAVGHRRVKLG